MKHITLNCIALIAIICSNINYIYAQLPSSDPAYQLVFSDEFTGSALDSTKWLKRYPWHQSSNYQKFWCDTATPVPMAAIKVIGSNGYYDTSNCKVSGGTVKLITKKENTDGVCWTWPSCHDTSTFCNAGSCKDLDGNGDSTCWHWDTLPFNFSTAMLYSKYDFRYGYFEIRFKLPALPPSPKTLTGHGGTFWLYSGTNGSDGYNYWSEIDIFEIKASNDYCFAGGNRNWKYENDSSTLHGVNWDNSWGNNVHCYFSPDTWHTAALNWTSSALEYYYDGVLQWVSRNYPDSLSPMAIIINCGGNYTPTDNYCTPFDTVGADSTHFPYTYEIDYVKVWQPKKDCDTTVNLTSFNPATYDNKLHKSVTMGTNVNITNQSNQSFWSSDYIQINEGTTIDNQSNVLFNVTNCNNVDSIKVFPINERSPEIAFPPPASFLEKINNND